MNKDEMYSFLAQDTQIPEQYKQEIDIQETEPTFLDTLLGKAKDTVSKLNLPGLASSAAQGSLQGIQKFGRMMGPLLTKETPEEVEQKFKEDIEPYFPEKSEGYIGKSVERGLKEAPSMLAFPGSSLASILPRSIAAGFLGEGAKDIGLPEWAQSMAELTAFIGPDITKKLLESGSNKEIIKAAREFGLKDEQIAPLLNSETKQKWLSKLSPKRGRTQSVLEETKKGLSQAEEKIATSKAAQQTLSAKGKEEFFNEVGKLAKEKIPSSTIDKVKQDFVNFAEGEHSGERLINLWRKLNDQYPKLAKLQQFKRPLEKALRDISPELAADFGKLNNLWSRYFNISKKLKPNIVSDVIRAGEALGLLHGIYALNPAGIQAILAENGARITARELLVNPRLQQLSEKFLNAINQNKWGIASNLTDKIKKQFNKIDKNIQFEALKEDELKKLFDND